MFFGWLEKYIFNVLEIPFTLIIIFCVIYIFLLKNNLYIQSEKIKLTMVKRFNVDKRLLFTSLTNLNVYLKMTHPS